MKITDIELHEIHPPLQAWNRDVHRLYLGDVLDTRTIIVLRTDNGLEGLGEYNGAVDERLQQELERLRGTNPCCWLAHPELTIWVAPAIYDLVGKANDVPAYQFFGPRVRSWVPMSSWTVSQTPAQMAAEEEDVVEALEVVAGQVRVPEQPGLGVDLDREALERLKAAIPDPMPRALIRVQVEGAAAVYARPPMLYHPHLKVGDVPGVGEGYNQQADQNFWHDDGSEKFAALWEQTADRAVFEREAV